MKQTPLLSAIMAVFGLLAMVILPPVEPDRNTERPQQIPHRCLYFLNWPLAAFGTYEKWGMALQ